MNSPKEYSLRDRIEMQAHESERLDWANRVMDSSCPGESALQEAEAVLAEYTNEHPDPYEPE